MLAGLLTRQTLPWQASLPNPNLEFFLSFNENKSAQQFEIPLLTILALFGHYRKIWKTWTNIIWRILRASRKRSAQQFTAKPML